MALDELPFPIFYFSIRQLDEIRINDGRVSPNSQGVVRMRTQIMDDQLPLPLTIKTRSGSFRDTQLPRKGSPLTTRLDLPISLSRFSSSPPWQDAQVKPDRTRKSK